MATESHRFEDLESMIDQVHRLFDKWEQDWLCANGSRESLYRAKLAVHEWLANLVQHAQFPEKPEVLLKVKREEGDLECVIEDNSNGFDLAGQMQSRHKLAEAFPERGMGLLLLQACAQDLSYRRVEEGRQRLRFRVADGQTRAVHIPF